MSSEVFPSLTILREGYVRTPFHSNTTQRAPDGTRYALNHGESGWRFEFTVLTKDATERATLEDFFNARKGSWDTFYFTDPETNAQHLVTFEEDSIPAPRESKPHLYKWRIAVRTEG